MHVSGTGVFLSLFLGNCKRTEQGRLFVWSFTHHLYSIQLVKHISLNLSLFHNSAEIFLTENEPCRQKLWNQGVLWEITRSNKTQKFSLTRIPNTKNKRNIFTHSALRYEMADESVSIKRGTLWFSGLRCWPLFRSFFRFFALKIFSFLVFGVYRFAGFPFLAFSFRITDENFRLWYFVARSQFVNFHFLRVISL